MKNALLNWWWSNQNNFGLLSFLLNQPNNSSQNIKIKIATQYGTGNNWVSGTNYGFGSRAQYPIGSSVTWQTVNAITGAPNNTTPPSLSNPDWELAISFDMIQDSGNGVNFFRTMMMMNGDDFSRINTFQYGTYANAQFTNSTDNYETFGQLSSTADSINTSTAVPAAKSFTAGIGVSQFFNSSTLATYTNTFSIPITPTVASYNLGAGLSISSGDTITFYGDSTHFFIFMVSTYDSSSGIAKGCSILNVGTGSFNSWTVKKEVFVNLKWQSGATNASFLIQTYNSGTGAVTATMVVGGGATLSGWDIFYARRPKPLTSSQSTNYNLSGAALGCSHFFSFTGTGLVQRTFKDSTGTGWAYIYVSGPSAGQADVIVDTYNSSSLANQTLQVYSNLAYGTHRIMAISVASPNISSTNGTAWIYGSTNTGNFLSYNENIDYDLFTPQIECGINLSDSFGEIAYFFKLNSAGGDTPSWFPYHGDKTYTQTSKVYTIDDNILNQLTLDGSINKYLYKYQSFTTAKVEQVGTMVHPQQPGTPFANITSKHILDRTGISWDVSMTWLVQAQIATGYNNMVSLGETWFNKSKNTAGVYMNRPSDNTSVNMASNFRGDNSYLFYSTSASDPAKSLVLAQYWNDQSIWRIGGLNSGTPYMFDFTGAAGCKFYPYAYSGYVTSINEVFRIQGKHYLGWLQNANSNL